MLEELFFLMDPKLKILDRGAFRCSWYISCMGSPELIAALLPLLTNLPVLITPLKLSLLDDEFWADDEAFRFDFGVNSNMSL